MGNEQSIQFQNSQAFVTGSGGALGNQLAHNRVSLRVTSNTRRAMVPAVKTCNKIKVVGHPPIARTWSVQMKAGTGLASGPPDDSDRNRSRMNKYGMKSTESGAIPEIKPLKASVDSKGNIIPDTQGGFSAFAMKSNGDESKQGPIPFDFKQAQYSSYIEMIKQKQQELPKSISVPELSEEVQTLQKGNSRDEPETKGKLQTALVDYEKHINEFKSKSNELLKIRSLYNEKKHDQEYFDQLSYMFWQYYELKARVAISRQTLEDAYKEANKQSNQQESKEIKADNEAIFGVIPQGWGSVTVGKIDDETGELVEINRHPSQDDLKYVANYLNFLNAQWELSKDSIEDAEGSGQDIAEKMVNLFQEQPKPKPLGMTEEEQNDPEFQERLNKINNQNGLTKELQNYNTFSRARQFMRNFNISRWQKPQEEEKVEQTDITPINSKKMIFQKLDEDVEKLLKFEEYLEKGIEIKFNFLTEEDFLKTKQIMQNPDIPQDEKDTLKMELSRSIADRINTQLASQQSQSPDLKNNDLSIQAQLFSKLDEDMRNLKRLDNDRNFQGTFHFVSKEDIMRIKDLINSESATDEQIQMMKEQLGKDIAMRMQQEVAKLNNTQAPTSQPAEPKGQIKIPVQDAKGFRVLNQQEMLKLPAELQAMADKGEDLRNVTIYKVDGKTPRDEPTYIVIYRDAEDSPTVEQEPQSSAPAIPDAQYRKAEFDLEEQKKTKKEPKNEATSKKEEQAEEFDQTSPLQDFENSQTIGSLGLNEQLSVEVKRRELNKKFIIKNNLNKIFGGAQDNRSENWSQYFNKLSQIYRREIYSNVDPNDYQELMDADLFDQPENLKSFVISRPGLSLDEKNQIFHLHNSASNDEKYGQRLLHYVLELVAEGKLEEKDDYRIFIYSIDWPVDIQIDKIHEKEVLKEAKDKKEDLE